MHFHTLPLLCGLLACLISFGSAHAQNPAVNPTITPLPNTTPLTLEGDLAAQMVTGIDRYLDRILEDAPTQRARHWHRDFSSPDAFVRSVVTNRSRLSHILGVVDPRATPELTHLATAPIHGSIPEGSLVATAESFKVYNVKWRVFRQVEAEGLLLQPNSPPVADVVAVPDADQSPEQIAGLAQGLAEMQQFARKLAASGCRVLIPTLIDRSDTHSGLPGVRHLRQSQREVLWRASYQMGRTIQGYEIQKVLAAIDWLSNSRPDSASSRKIGVYGYGEGGMISFLAGALDTRIHATGSSGFHFNTHLHEEPIYRNIWSFSDQFSGAQVANLIAPRRLVVEAGQYPTTEYPPAGQKSDGAAPGKIAPPHPDEARKSLEYAREWLSNVPGVSDWKLVRAESDEIGSSEALESFLAGLDASLGNVRDLPKNSVTLPPSHFTQRMLRQYSQILEDTQWLMRESEFTRREFWKKVDRKNAQTFATSAQVMRNYFAEEIVGLIPKASMAPRPRSRKVSETDAFTGYEVVLDVHQDVFAYGILLIPKGIPPGEKRPVVVCQHGLEGRPNDVANPKVDNPAYHTYACRLAERGFITFSPQNPYIGENRFRQVLRKAQPLGLTLWSFIHRQHEVILDWLTTQPQVDPSRMAFYGLSYGGKTAMRIPTLLDRYCLSICSADYNEWIWKNVSARHSYSYLYWGEYDMPEFNLGNTFNYAELSWLIFPRPFMVERGHDDGVAPDEWVAYEFAKTRRHYVKMGMADRTEIEFFDGPHTIHGKGTFDFLHRHLNWPKR